MVTKVPITSYLVFQAFAVKFCYIIFYPALTLSHIGVGFAEDLVAFVLTSKDDTGAS